MFDTLIVQPIFNVLALIYALLPGHNFGVAIILFTVVIRLLLWPLVKKQLHNAKAMRALQPELKKIKQKTKGNKLLERQLTLELYREREINPYSSIGIALVQLPILIGLYIGLTRVVKDPNYIITFAYEPIQNLPWMQYLADHIHKFDETLLGFVDLSKSAVGDGGIYWPAMIIVIGAVVAQYFQSKQLMPVNKDARKLRTILKDTSQGKEADQEELSAAINRSMMLFLPFLIFIFTIGIPSGLSLYILVGALVGLAQQTYVLGKDVDEIESTYDKNKAKGKKEIIEGEVIKQESEAHADSGVVKTKTHKKKPNKARKKKRR